MERGLSLLFHARTFSLAILTDDDLFEAGAGQCLFKRSFGN
jgi:hypothetical protein